MKNLMSIPILMILLLTIYSCKKEACDELGDFRSEFIKINDITPSIGILPISTFKVGDTLTFSHGVISDEDLTIEWKFGEDNVGEGSPVTHVFEEAGEYTIEMRLSASISTNRSKDTCSFLRSAVILVE